MEKEKNGKCNCGGENQGCGCGCHCCGHRHLIKIILKIIILVIIFSAGVKVGEMKSEFGHGYNGGYGSYRMMPRDFYDGQPYPIMQGTQTAPAQPAAPVATSTKK